MSFHVPEKFRLAVPKSSGQCGVFLITLIGSRKVALRCVASDGEDWIACGLSLPAWEHVSISTPLRCPTWEEMCFVKSLFWDPDDAVMQLHPPQSEWINNHPFCLHLWRPVGVEIPRPPMVSVGIR